MAKNSRKNRNNLVHFLDEDEIENELTFFEEDGQIKNNDFKSNRSFKRRKLYNTIDTINSKQNFNSISPISFAPNISSPKDNKQNSFSLHNSINVNKRKSNSIYNNGIENNVNNSYIIDANEPFMPAHKSIKIDTNADAITSPIPSASTSPVYTSTPIAISTPISQRTAMIPIRSSTPILPPSLLKSESSFSSISSISSINKSKNDSNLSSIREDYNSPSDFSSSSQSNDISTNNDNIPNNTSTPISLVKYSSNSSPPLELNEPEENLQNIDDVKDIFSTEKLMNSKLIINLPSSVRNKNLYWNLGINSSDSPFLPFTKEINEKNSIFSPYRSPILRNDETSFDSSDYVSSPSQYQKQKNPENTSNELVLFKPIPWKQPLQNMIEGSSNSKTINTNTIITTTNNNNNNNNDNNNLSPNDLMINITQNNNKQNDSLNNVNSVSNSSTPTSAIITNKLPLLSLNKSPDKSNNSYTTSNAIPIPIPSSQYNNTNNSNINIDTNAISPISPISLSLMNLDSSLMTTTNSSPTSKKEIEIPYSQDTTRYYGNLSSSSFSNSPSPITSSALMNGISRNNTELQSNVKYSRNNIDTGLNENNCSDLFDYKNDLLPSNSDNHDNDTITTTNTVDYDIIQPADSMDVDF